MPKGNKKAIARRCLPTGLPVNSSILYALALDHFKAPMWAWGAVGMFMALVWISILVSISQTDYIDVFEAK